MGWITYFFSKFSGWTVGVWEWVRNFIQLPILLSLWGLLILMWRLWTRFDHKNSYPSSPPAHVSSPPNEEFTIDVSGASCYIQVKPGPRPERIWIAWNTMAWLDPLDVRCNHQRPSQLARDAARRAGEGTPQPSSGMALPCRTQGCLIEESPETLSRRRSWPWWL